MKRLLKINEQKERSMKKRIVRSLLFTFFTFLLPLSLMAQNRSISGTVVDTGGEPLIGVSVLEKGTTNGTLTDLNGKFTLTSLSNVSIISISYIGYVPQEFSVGSQTTFNITLQEDNKILDEVVVIGYGTAKKSDITGALSSVTSKDIEKQPVLNVATAMQGKVPGAVIQSNNGNPGQGLKIRIRGANSINGNNDPLYIIDGIAGNINTINPNDVASIEILKDASATAIYGSRGANGVVLITTKRGYEGATKIQFTSDIGINNLPKKYDIVDAGTYAELINTLKGSDYFSPDQITGYEKNGGTDWQDEIFQTGVTQNYQLSLTGGGKNTSYYLSGNYTDQTGIVINTKAKAWNFRSNISTSFLEKFKFDLNLTASRSSGMNTNDNGAMGSPVWLAPIMSPTFNPYGEDGGWNLQNDGYDNLSGPGSGYRNPLMTLKERYNDYHNNGWGLNTKLNYQIIDGLSLDVLFSTGISNNKSGTIQNKIIVGKDQPTFVSQTLTQYDGWQNTNILTYNKNFGKIHNLTITGVNEQSYSDETQMYAAVAGMDPISLGYDNLGAGTGNKSVSSYRKEWTLQSWLGRVNYSLMDRYLLTVSYRADGSSKFTKNNKWAYFPSAALAWRVSEESFLKNIGVIDNLKLRASWGATGNQGIDVYANIASYYNYNFSFGQETSQTGNAYGGVSNPDLKWETTKQTNLGIDLGIFNGRVNLTADYYTKKTTDLLLGVAVPNYNGGGTMLKNVGSVRNRGFEITLYGNAIRTKDFSWDYNLNFSTYKSKVLELGADKEIFLGNPNDGLLTENFFVIKEGEQLSSFYGYVWEGIYTEAEAAEAAKYGFKPGDNKYKDISGPDGVPDGVIDSADKQIIGHGNPKASWGFDNTFTYKDFSLNIMLQALTGRDVFNVMYGAASTVRAQTPNITTKDGADFWTADNQKAKFANPLSSTGKSYLNSTQFLQNGDFLKVKNIALSYLLRKNITKIADFKFTISGQNLLTFTKYKGYDPESSSYGGDTQGGVDYGAYPNPRSVTFGVQVNF